MSVQVTEVFASDLSGLAVPDQLARQLRRADDFIRLAVVAGYSVLQSMAEPERDKERIGLFLGSAFGPMQTNFDVLDQVVSDQPVSPTIFSHSVFNGAAGYLASVFGIKGCAMTMTDFEGPFFRALEQGMLAVSTGKLDACLVLQVETYSRLLHDARKTHCQGSAEWQPGVICWLLESADCSSGKACVKSLRICQRPVDSGLQLSAGSRLQVMGQLSCSDKEYQVTEPLGAAHLLSQIVNGECGAGSLGKVSLSSPNTTVELELS